MLPVQGWARCNKTRKQNTRSPEIRGSDVGNVRLTNVDNEARSNLCILVTSRMVIGLQFNPQGSQLSVGFSVVRILWNVATILTVFYCMYVLCIYMCVYVRNLLFVCLRWFGLFEVYWFRITANFHTVEIFSITHFGKIIFLAQFVGISNFIFVYIINVMIACFYFSQLQNL